MQRFAYWLFPFIAAAVAAFIVAFMIEINLSAPGADEVAQGCEEGNDSCDVEVEGPNWLKRFSLTEEKEYFYPVNEVHLILGNAEEAPKMPTYRLSVPLKDHYELFCLKQELMSSGLPYLLQQEGNATTLLVDSNDRNKLASLVTKLKTYQISATVSPYTEEK